jgi:hypothetical protein
MINDIFNMAEQAYMARLQQNTFVSAPDYYRFPLPLPQYGANAFVVVRDGKIKEIEIHYEDNGIQTVRPGI